MLSNVAPHSLLRKAVTDNMLQVTEAHPNSPVYADLFEHPPPQLASLLWVMHKSEVAA